MYGIVRHRGSKAVRQNTGLVSAGFFVHALQPLGDLEEYFGLNVRSLLVELPPKNDIRDHPTLLYDLSRCRRR